MAQIQFLVTVEDDGTITTLPTTAPTAGLARTATTYDVFQTCKELCTEIETHILVNRIAQTVVASLTPISPSAEIPLKIKDALSDRGITTE